MPSKRKLAPVVGRDGISSGSAAREQDISTVELDTTFARVLGLADGQRVRMPFETREAHSDTDAPRSGYTSILIHLLLTPSTSSR